jgi:hypothetical protein
MKGKGVDSLKVLGIKVLPSYLFTFLLLTLSGCIEEYEADIAKEDSDLFVVEGTICSGKMNKFYLSRAQAINPSKTPHMVTGAKVSVRGSDGSEYIAQNSYYNYGYYTCQIDTLYPDVEYYLHIEADGEVFESEPQKPLPTEKIADVKGVQNTPESNIDVLVTPSEPFASDQAHYYSWTYDETWEVHPDYITGIYYDVEKKKPVDKTNQFPLRGWKDATGSTIMVGASTSYDGQHIRGLKLYDIDRTHERMYYRYSGLIHQRAISKAEYEYELAQRQAGSEMGGLFTPQPSALPTNIHCLTSRRHVIGYVGCSLNTSEYRFFLHPKDFSTFHYPHPDTRLWIDNPTEMECLRLVARGMFLCEWDEPMGGVLRTAWAYLYQLDVRYHGAYVEEPEFWSWNENRSY